MARMPVIAIVLSLGAVCSAVAGGSVSPDEVLRLAEKDTKLNSEINQRLRGAPRDSITCTAARIGRDTGKDLGDKGGARVGPYTCDVGRSKLELRVEEPPGAKASPTARKSGLSWKWR